jgi:hypothetical protein
MEFLWRYLDLSLAGRDRRHASDGIAVALRHPMVW